MGHYVTGIITVSSVAEQLYRDKKLASAALRDGMRLVPLEDEDLDLIATFDGPPTHGFTHLSKDLIHTLSELSMSGRLVYFETEYFGGMGSQSAVAFEGGSIIPTTLQSGDGVINKALRAIGVVSNSEVDEFDYIGLSLHRNTSDWKEVAALANKE
ncbi:MAG: hypothetical protein U1F81_09715 [Verrucomicrobiaceae bacterium]|jgi:hypothetical protein